MSIDDAGGNSRASAGNADSHQPPATTSENQPSRPHRRLLRHLQDAQVQVVVFALSAVGAVIYFVLVLLYERFYSPLGIEPEEVGLDRTAILTRAVGGVVAIVGVTVVLTAYVFVIRVFYWLVILASHWGFTRIRISEEERVKQEAAIRRLGLHRLNWVPFYIPFVTNPKDHRPFGRSTVLSVLGSAAVLTLAATLYMGLNQVNAASRAAAIGETVTPLTFVGLRVLDVESTPCKAVWIGDPGQEPAILKSLKLHCLGSAGDRLIMRDGRATYRVPASQVIVVTQ